MRLRGRAAWAACAVVIGAAAWAWSALRPRAPRRPNVLLLVMDTVRGDRCSVNGSPRATTPRLAEFAKDAVVYRDAWSPANWTGPAHASLFTGLRMENHGFYEGNRRYLADSCTTLGEMLSDAGYATACFSNNGTVSTEFGFGQGFRKVEPLFEREGREYPWAPATHRAALAWAREQARADKPFFLFVNDMEPHLPYTPPGEFASQFVRGAPTGDELAAARSFLYPRTFSYDLGIEDLTAAQLALLSDLYDAEVAALDDAVGDLLAQMRAEGLLDDTVVVITSDHGENLGEHHLFEHALGLHRTLLHVPLVVRRPGVLDGGRTVDDVVRLEDVCPTVLELCGVALPPGLDGSSLLSSLPGRVARAWQPPQIRALALYEQDVGPTDTSRLARGIESVYDGRFHLIAYSDGTEELFDVRADPCEERDLSAALPDDAARLRALRTAPALVPAPAMPARR